MSVRAALLLCMLAVCTVIAACDTGARPGAGTQSGRSSGSAGSIIDALSSGHYRYSASISAIPPAVLRCLDSLRGTRLHIGDASDSTRINFTDAVYDTTELRQMLRFVLVGNGWTLLVYKQGGLAVYDIVEFLRYDAALSYVRYGTLDRIYDVNRLRAFLRTEPRPEKR